MICKLCGTEFFALTANRKICDKCKYKPAPKRTKKRRCICCNSVIKEKRSKYCLECRKIKTAILQREANLENKRNEYNFKDIEADVQISDMKFKTNKCNQDCFNCKFKECIL